MVQQTTWFLKRVSAPIRVCPPTRNNILIELRRTPSPCTAPVCSHLTEHCAEFLLNKVGTRAETHSFSFHLWGVQLFHKCAGLVTFNADRGHHFTGDHTQQLHQERRGQLELGGIFRHFPPLPSTRPASQSVSQPGFLQRASLFTFRRRMHSYMRTPFQQKRAPNPKYKVSTQSLLSVRCERGRTRVRAGCNKAVCLLLQNEM